MKKKILIGAPHYMGIPAKFVVNTTRMTLDLAAKGWESNIYYAEGTLISTQRNKIAQTAVDEDYDYLFFIDSDMDHPMDEVYKLLDIAEDPYAGVEIIGGLYYGRRAPHKPMVFSEYTGEHFVGIKQRDIEKNDGKPFTCAGIGTGFLLISVDVLKKMMKPKFLKRWGGPFSHHLMKTGVQLGEDLSFCVRAAEAGHEIWCHPDVDLGHESTMTVTKATHLQSMKRDIHYCNPISGWMFINELNWLYWTAREMDTIVEIGSWKGRSTHALCSGTQGHVYAVDHFEGSWGEDEQHQEANTDDIEKQFMANVGNRFSNVTVVKANSLDYAKACALAGKKFDMVFLDGGHQYPEFKADLEAWEPLARKIFCGHDYNMFPGVTKAVNERYKAVKTLETIWIKEIEK